MTGDNQYAKRFTAGRSGKQVRLFFLFLPLVFAAIFSSLLFVDNFSFSAPSPKQQTALEHFEKAVQLRTALEAKPVRLRTAKEYLKVINEFRSVYWTSPASSKADDSMYAIVELYQSMARDLKDDIYFSSAIKTCALLRKEYPGSPLRVKAAFTAAEILRKNLHDLSAAQEAYTELLKKYPQSPYARQAKARLMDLKTEMKQFPKNSVKSKSESSPVASKAEKPNSPMKTKADPGPMIVKSQVPADLSAESHLAKTQAADRKSSAPKEGQEKAVPSVNEKTDTPRHENGSHNANPGQKEDSAPKIAKKNEKPALSSSLPETAAMAPMEGKTSNTHKTIPAEASRKSQSVDELIAENSHVSTPKSDGTRSLTRTLGLKIGKIVIDPGHGGHDTGTIGPSGLREKDLVLDIAQKLKKLIEEKLGGEVVLTREDDTFIPLENRTEIANQHQADLFISIHANSSRNKKIRGVETFFLNFATSADVEEVAARENATSQKTIFELQDLIQKIALKEKVEESREFALNIQKAMSGTLLKSQPQARNRGVKQAPFIVLIGANMPSILAEVSFVSNPADEKLLRSASYRQKVAESLLEGINNYSLTLSGIKTAHNLSRSSY
jgi:N-acetylmuramoyl-L-alanine amidase